MNKYGTMPLRLLKTSNEILKWIVHKKTERQCREASAGVMHTPFLPGPLLHFKQLAGGKAVANQVRQIIPIKKI